jgi:hypothetical protein
MFVLNIHLAQSQNFKKITKQLAGILLGAALLTVGPAVHAGAPVNSFAYSFRAKMTNTGVDANAKGIVTGGLNRRGSIDNQHLNIVASKLDATTAYHLIAFLNDDTNAITVADFTTGKSGAAAVHYVKTKGTPKHPLPGALDPVTNVRELDIVKGSDTVLRAVLTSPDSFSYSLRRAMNNTGFLTSANGNLTLHGTPHTTKATIIAKGLAPSTSYQLVVNGVGFTTKTSTKTGHLTITSPRTGLPLVLDTDTISLNDGTNVVLITTGLAIPGNITTTTNTPQSGAVNLGSAASFAVLGGQSVTSTGNTVVDGNLGVWPGSSVTGFGPGVVNNGAIHISDGTAQTAQGDLTTAYNDAAGRTVAPIDKANADLGSQTLAPGLYKSTGTLSLTGTVTLDAGGDTNGVYIFQVASSLTTAPGSAVVLAGGAKASNIFWQVGSSVSLGTTTSFKGTIMALASVSLATGAQLEGRALARNASVTLDNNNVTVPAN